jgi:hypothetical protein
MQADRHNINVSQTSFPLTILYIITISPIHADCYALAVYSFFSLSLSMIYKTELAAQTPQFHISAIVSCKLFLTYFIPASYLITFICGSLSLQTTILLYPVTPIPLVLCPRLLPSPWGNENIFDVEYEN